MRLGRIGFDHVMGYLDGGLAAAASRPDLIGTTERMSPERASELLQHTPAIGIDVRTPGEWASKRIGGTRHVPLNRLEAQLDDVPRDTPLLVFCGGGYRSSIAASLLKRAGYPQVAEIAGGTTAWESAGLPMEKT